MARREIIRKMEAGVRLIEIVHDLNRRTFSRYAVTTLRNDERSEFTTIREARRAFEAEVVASRQDPRVGPHVG